MFGFFKKKGGEIPEEQQRQQRGAQEGQTRQDAAEVPQEFRALGQGGREEKDPPHLAQTTTSSLPKARASPLAGG